MKKILQASLKTFFTLLMLAVLQLAAYAQPATGTTTFSTGTITNGSSGLTATGTINGYAFTLLSVSGSGQINNAMGTLNIIAAASPSTSQGFETATIASSNNSTF